MGTTVRELQDRMDAREFAEWMAYYQVEPWGGEFDALERAMITTIIANVNRDSKKKVSPFKPEDFMFRFNEAKKVTSIDLMHKVKMLNAMMGGKDLTSGDTK